MRLEYLEIVDPDDMQPLERIRRSGVRGRRALGGHHAPDRQRDVYPMKLRSICKSKIHHAVVTGADLNYIGSIGIDKHLMELTDIVPGEQVFVWNVNNGERIETYAICLPAGSRRRCGERRGGQALSARRQDHHRRLHAHRRTDRTQDDLGERAQPIRPAAGERLYQSLSCRTSCCSILTGRKDFRQYSIGRKSLLLNVPRLGHCKTRSPR